MEFASDGQMFRFVVASIAWPIHCKSSRFVLILSCKVLNVDATSSVPVFLRFYMKLIMGNADGHRHAVFGTGCDHIWPTFALGDLTHAVTIMITKQILLLRLNLESEHCLLNL